MKRVVTYIADDGKEFSDPDECRIYEIHQAAKKAATKAIRSFRRIMRNSTKRKLTK